MRSQALFSAKALKGAALAAFAAVTLLAATGESRAQATFRAIQIDMSGVPGGAAETRSNLQACLAVKLPEAFAGRINPGARNAPVLTVRPTTVWLANAAATNIRDAFSSGEGTTSLDSLEGEAIVGGQRIPLIVSANPDFGAVGALGYASRVRTDVLCSSFAYWLAKKV
jgi:hypothetical protein